MNELFVCEMKKIYEFMSRDTRIFKLFILNNKSFYCSLITHLCVFILLASLRTFLVWNHAWQVQHKALGVVFSLRVQVLAERALERDFLSLAVGRSWLRLRLKQVQSLSILLCKSEYVG